MKRRARLIINPISGTSTHKAGIEGDAADILGDAWDIDCRYTTGPGDATRLAREAVAVGFDAVIAAGGDGTVNETARAMAHSMVPLGIIPCGSGNGLARHMALPVDVRESLRVIAEDHCVDADYATVGGRPFFCTFGVGLDAAVSERFATMATRGPISYLRSMISELRHYEPVEYALILPDGTRICRRALIVAVCNASQYGNNAYIAPHASITDGLLDVTIVDDANPVEKALVGLDLMTGYLDRNTRIQTFRTPSLTLETPGGPAHVDGEPVSLPTVLDIRCVPSALRLFTSSTKQPFRPVITPAQALLSDLRFTFRRLIRP